jgi:hypothetical protein
MRGVVLAWAILAGCSFRAGQSRSDGAGSGADAAGSDAQGSGSDAGDAAGSLCEMITSLGVNVCPTSMPSTAVDIAADTTFNTHDGMSMPSTPSLACAPLATAATPDACVVVVTAFTIDSTHTLQVTGDRPLIVIATASIDLAGTLDVASHNGGTTGPGPDNPGCTYGRDPTMGGGGQGGTFQSKAGDGSDQDTHANTGGLAGTAFGPPTALVKGCPGKTGGTGGGSGGAAGGVVLLATPQLTIASTGSINASGGAGGGAATSNHGGGGAGSGGTIVIDAKMISLATGGQIYANGAHGGGGSSTGNAGSAGTDPTSATSGGGGGNGGGSSGDGGTGAFGTTDATSGTTASSSDGGGGGGGGLGWLLVRTQSSLGASASISPAITTFTN